MVFDLKKEKTLKIAYEGEHNNDTITFEGFHPLRGDSACYFSLEGVGLIPLDDSLTMRITQTITHKAGHYMCQLVEVGPDNDLVQKSKRFDGIVSLSNRETEIPAEIKPEGELWYSTFKALWEHFKNGDIDSSKERIDDIIREYVEEHQIGLTEEDVKRIIEAYHYLVAKDIEGKADKSDVYTKEESENRYQKKGDYLTEQSLSGYAKESYVDQKVAAIVDSAPETLDTLKELSDALGNDKNFAKTITNELGKKANSSDVYTKTQSDGKFALKSDIPAPYDDTEIKKEIEDTKSSLSESILNIEEVKADKIALAEAEKKIAEQERKITNLEYAARGVLYREDVSESEDYTKDLESDVMPYGLLDYVGGKSVVCNQMIKGFQQDLGSVKMVGKVCRVTKREDYISQERCSCKIVMPNVKMNRLYYLAFDYNVIDDYFNGLVSFSYGITGIDNAPNKGKYCKIVSFTAESNGAFISFRSSEGGHDASFELSNYKCIDLTQMFGEGNEPTLEQCQQIFTGDYYPYNEGELVSKEFDEVVRVGNNRLTPVKREVSWGSQPPSLGGTSYFERGNSFQLSSIIEVKKGDKYVFSGDLKDVNSEAIRVLASKEYPKEGVKYKRLENIKYGTNVIVDIVEDYRYLTLLFINKENNVLFNYDESYKWKLEKGTVATPYKPYFTESKSIKDIISKYFPDGMKSAGNAYDLFDLENGVAVQNVGAVNLGDLYWGMTSADINRFNTSNPLADIKDGNLTKMLTAKYQQTSSWSVLENTDKMIHTLNRRIYVSDSAYSSVTEFKTALSGIPLYYELVEPIITPIDPSDLETIRTLHVEAGGTLTFTNTNEGLNIPIQNKETFLVKTGGVTE